ncbi:MAG TPA: hypothetical protein VE842_17115 [Pyrinomonadaceae bacterium]|jgi:hypothetical protein|nr:hypothetical protein [Pyrinomonadaceae bacterium]
MTLTTANKASVFLSTLVLLMLATQTLLATAQRALPNPVVIYIGPEFYQQEGKQWTRYKLMVTNYDAYPNELFAPAPSLPPCGENTKAARTWVEITDGAGKRIYGFCALATHDDLTKLWFAIETDKIPPSWVYVILNDRQTGKTYKSGLIETTE